MPFPIDTITKRLETGASHAICPIPYDVHSWTVKMKLKLTSMGWIYRFALHKTDFASWMSAERVVVDAA